MLIKSLSPENPSPNAPCFAEVVPGPTRVPKLCGIANIEPKTCPETDAREPWKLRDLRKTCGDIP